MTDMHELVFPRSIPSTFDIKLLTDPRLKADPACRFLLRPRGMHMAATDLNARLMSKAHAILPRRLEHTITKVLAHSILNHCCSLRFHLPKPLGMSQNVPFGVLCRQKWAIMARLHWAV
jgi:hypothetical protein